MTSQETEACETYHESSVPCNASTCVMNNPFANTSPAECVVIWKKILEEFEKKVLNQDLFDIRALQMRVVNPRGFGMCKEEGLI